jgi:hypothetical protein
MMVSLPLLGTPHSSWPPNDTDLPLKKENINQLPDRFDNFNHSALSIGARSVESNQRSLCRSSEKAYTRYEDNDFRLQSETLLENNADFLRVLEQATINATGISSFHFSESQDGKQINPVRAAMEKYFASVKKADVYGTFPQEIFRYSCPSHGSEFTRPGTTKIEKDRNISWKDELVEYGKINKGIESARIKGKHSLKFIVNPTAHVFSSDGCQGNARYVQYGDIFRDMLHKTERQHKEKAKIIRDNGIIEQKLKEANIIIETLTAKIERRRLALKTKEESQQGLLNIIESLRKERDEKSVEYNKLTTLMNDAIAERKNKIEELAKLKEKSEASYHQELRNNIELKSNIESKERHIKALKEKVEKARKWKNEIA